MHYLVSRKGRREFLLTLSGLAATAVTTTVRAAELTPLLIGTSSDANNGGLIIVAKQMNYFRDNGLDVTIKYFPSAGDLVAAMAAGALYVGAGSTVPTATLRGGGFPVVVLAQQADISGAQQVVASEAVKTPRDFEGKKVGALFGTSSEMLANAMLIHYNIPASGVTIVNLGPADMVTALLRGDISGAALWEPWVSQAVKGGAHRLVSGSYSFVPNQTGQSRLIGVHSVLVAPKPWVEKNATIVAGVLKSLLAAERLVETQPDKVADIVGKELRVPTDEMKAQMAFNHYSLTINAGLVRDMASEAEFLYAHGKLKSQVRPADWIDTAPLKEVSPTSVTWAGA